jgi:putative nucleotidyltransferase with HDIG domain
MLPLAWFYRPIPAWEWPTLLYLAIGTQIAALRPIPWKTGHQTVVDPLLVATGLFSPGAGVGLVAWLTTFDGRVPGRNIPWWTFFFRPAESAAIHVLPSIAVASIGHDAVRGLDYWWSVPLRTAVYVIAVVGLNYLITALAVSLVRKESFFNTLLDNVGLPTTAATLALSFAGGILYLLLQAQPFPVGYIIAPALFIFVLAVRGTIGDVQRQTVLKDQTLELAAQALDARDRYTESHSIRVSELAGRLGEHLELGDRECELIRTAGSLHDLGKIGVRDDILNKPGPLTEDEWEIMRRHPDLGADMIAQHSALAEVAPLVRHHHERWDGTGYPAGLRRDVIPFGARILAVADSFDTITGSRLYRKTLMTAIEGVEDISRRANHWYDPNVVDALREIHGLSALEVGDRPEVPRRVTAYRVLRANPGFANLITAIGISAIGDPLTQVATLVSLFLFTGDARLVALAFMVQAIATILTTTLIGGVTDRVSRRYLVVGLDFCRAALLLATPILIAMDWRLLLPVLFVLAALNAIVQPARQAAIPALVPPAQVGKANAMVSATTMLAAAIGYGLAGGILAWNPKAISTLFMVDASTFALAAAIVLGVPTLGGGVARSPIFGALRRSWSLTQARPHLVVGGLASCLIPLSFPALVTLAYRLSCQPTAPQCAAGGQTYSAFEVILSVGIFIGALAVSRVVAIGSMRVVGLGLLITGGLSIVIAMTTSPVVIAAALLIASIGNPIYQVANQTALIEAADPTNRGSVMSTRFGLVQTASIVGTAVGGLITKQYGPFTAYAFLGVGLVVLAMYAIAAGRSTTNPLHGAAYEEATALHEVPPYTDPPNGAGHEKSAALQHANKPSVGSGDHEAKANTEPFDDAAFREAAGRQ